MTTPEPADTPAEAVSSPTETATVPPADGAKPRPRRFDPRDRRTLTAVALLLVLLLAPLLRFALFLSLPAGTGKNVRVLDFEKGYTPRRIADELERAGIISSARLFVIFTRLSGDAGRLKAGEYQLSDAMRPSEILRKMVNGEVYAERFAVPEGYSIYQVAELLEERRIFRRDAFLRAAGDPKLLAELGIDGKSVEGYLFPSTYNVTKKMDEAALIRTMVAHGDKVYAERFAAEARRLGVSRREITILASLIEKEAVSPAERPLISSVFHNRLRKGMRLQSDPTALYGIRAFGGNVTKRDIERATPYNTYIISGLPPGPIGNPSEGAMEAALHPAQTPYLYFVAKGDGTHLFSTTLDEHNAAVRTYLRGGAELRTEHPSITGSR
ncbi:endolytic transglycosylase MltG [Geobacter sp.]|uniref:endolytic transglycosylase MltG n=1 Tax=Geobacter sp. TaxID=46610 RepID=UPI002638B403|nr:endolytic transglycosylase MltG [Geobacter sp.]